jgi:glycosyltransferase involved in cell wall biosynthesis
VEVGRAVFVLLSVQSVVRLNVRAASEIKGTRPARPRRLDAQRWSDRDIPVVSICCITYNQAAFIRDCLDGFFMQETTFPVEIVIHDDASSDGTANIIREYEARHPYIIRAIYQTENQYLKVRHPDVVFNFPRSRGRYIALCEGDDYWTAPDKLQTQVNFMESHPQYSGCFHNVSVVYEDGSTLAHPQYAQPLKDTFTLQDFAAHNYIATPSALFRARLFPEFPAWYARVPLGDWPLHVLNAEHGAVGYMDRICAVYRVHPRGVWSSLSELQRHETTIDVAKVIDAHLDFRFTNAIRKRIAFGHYSIAVNMSIEGMDHGIAAHLRSSLPDCLTHECVSKRTVAVLLIKHSLPALFLGLKRLQVLCRAFGLLPNASS